MIKYDLKKIIFNVENGGESSIKERDLIRQPKNIDEVKLLLRGTELGFVKNDGLGFACIQELGKAKIGRDLIFASLMNLFPKITDNFYRSDIYECLSFHVEYAKPKDIDVIIKICRDSLLKNKHKAFYNNNEGYLFEALLHAKIKGIEIADFLIETVKLISTFPKKIIKDICGIYLFESIMHFFTCYPDFADIIIPIYKSIMSIPYNPIEKEIAKFCNSFNKNTKKNVEKINPPEKSIIIKLENPIAGITDDAVLFSMVNENVFLINNLLYIIYHKIIEKSSGTEWLTDREEFGLVVFDINSLKSKNVKIVYYKIPAKFGFNKTGAQGDKRYIKFYGMYKSNLYFKLNIPFSDDRGWGAENLYYTFNTKTGQFMKVTKNAVTKKTGFSNWIEGAKMQFSKLNPENPLDYKLENNIKKYISNLIESDRIELIISGKIHDDVKVLVYRCLQENLENCPDEGIGDFICFLN